MSEPDLLADLCPVLQVLSNLGVRHFIGESIASSAHSVARASVDGDAVARRASFNLLHLDTMLKVDVFVSRDRPFDRRAFERSRPTSIEGEGGATLPVSSAEDVVLAKLDWYRRGGEVSERQWTDVMGVLQATGSALDLPYLHRGAVELGVSDLLERALDEADRAGR